jgi:hypothetical protein
MLHVFTDGSVDTLDVRLRTLQEQREAAGAVGDMGDDNDEDEVEIIEVEEPFEPVPMQDSCLQVFYNLMTNFGTRKNECKMFVCLDFFSLNCYLVVQDTVLVHEVQIMDLLSLSNDGNFKLCNTTLKLLSMGNYTFTFCYRVLGDTTENLFSDRIF